MNIDRYMEAIISTTHVDSQNECMSLEALYSMAEQAKKHPIWVTVDHDPAIPPIGITLEAQVVKLEDGHHALQAKSAIFDHGSYPLLEKPRDLADLTSEIELYSSENSISIRFNPHHVDDKVFDGLEEINGIPVIYVHAGEKSQDPPWWIIFALTPLFDGFLKGIYHEITGETIEDTGKNFARFVKHHLIEFKKRASDIYQAKKQTSSPDRRYYIIYEFCIGQTSCEALILLKGNDAAEAFKEIEMAEDSLEEFFKLSQTITETHGNLDKLKFAFIPFRGWEILYATTASREVYVGDLGNRVLSDVSSLIP